MRLEVGPAASQAQTEVTWMLAIMVNMWQWDRGRLRQASAALAADGAELEALLTEVAHPQHEELVALEDRVNGDHSLETVRAHSLQDSCPHVKADDRLAHGPVCLKQARKLGRVKVGAGFGPHDGWDLGIGVDGLRRRGWLQGGLVGAHVLRTALSGSKTWAICGGKGEEIEKVKGRKKNKKSNDFACAHHPSS